ncbi:hypothetical protein D3C71_1203130 [compost metagenome]
MPSAGEARHRVVDFVRCINTLAAVASALLGHVNRRDFSLVVANDIDTEHDDRKQVHAQRTRLDLGERQRQAEAVQEQRITIPGDGKMAPIGGAVIVAAQRLDQIRVCWRLRWFEHIFQQGNEQLLGDLGGRDIAAIAHDDDLNAMRRRGEHLAGASHHATRMMEDVDAPPFLPDEAEAVRIQKAVVQLGWRHHLVGQGLRPDSGRYEMGQPTLHVVERRGDPALPQDHRREDALRESTVGLCDVRGGTTQQRFQIGRPQERVVHRQRFEQALAQPLRQRYAQHPLQHHGEHAVAAVVVDELLAGLEVLLVLPALVLECAFTGHDGHPIRKQREIEIVTRPTRVVHELTQRTGTLARRQLRQPSADRLVDRQRAFIAKQQRQSTGEVLGRRADAHLRGRRVDHAGVETCQAIAAAQQRLAALLDAGDQARCVVAMEIGEYSLQLFDRGRGHCVFSNPKMNEQSFKFLKYAQERRSSHGRGAAADPCRRPRRLRAQGGRRSLNERCQHPGRVVGRVHLRPLSLQGGRPAAAHRSC